MTDFERRRGEFVVNTDRAQLDLQTIADFLGRESYWASGRSIELVQRSIENSLCFGLYKSGSQIGFARVVSDRATFAWLCDVFVVQQYRGQGLGKWLVACVMEHPDLQTVRRFMLATRDAHTLYQEVAGFVRVETSDGFMTRPRRGEGSAEGSAAGQASE